MSSREHKVSPRDITYLEVDDYQGTLQHTELAPEQMLALALLKLRASDLSRPSYRDAAEWWWSSSQVEFWCEVLNLSAKRTREFAVATQTQTGQRTGRKSYMTV